jgi:hypothetical protein
MRLDTEDDDDDDDERPWNEARWREFMREGELRAARYGELLETLMDDPDRDAKIAREMGWGRDGEDDQGDDDATDATDDDTFDPEAIIAAAEAEVRGKVERGEPLEEGERDDVERLPVYQLATDVGSRVRDALHPYMQGRVDDDYCPEDDPIGQAYINALIPGAKIAGGHGMGYEDEVLCGNIVCCTIAGDAARKCREFLLILREQGTVPASVIEPLLPHVDAMRDGIAEHVAALRARVWW